MVVTGLLAVEVQHGAEHLHDNVHDGLSVRTCLLVPHGDISGMGKCFLGLCVSKLAPDLMYVHCR